jgi:hypothetical protein
MKLWFLLVATSLGAAAAADAQPAEPVGLPRADAHGTIGWENIHHPQATPGSYSNDWLNSVFYGSAGAGWYWTDHLKTQVDVGAGTRARQYNYHPIFVSGQSTTEFSELRLQDRDVAIGQQYQFFRNQWFHPHVGAGLDIVRETTTEEYQAVTIYDSTTRLPRVLSPPHTDGPEHRFIARPFGEVGFKGYMTRRAFFMGDARVMFRHGVDEVLFRIGFGVDF